MVDDEGAQRARAAGPGDPQLEVAGGGLLILTTPSITPWVAAKADQVSSGLAVLPARLSKRSAAVDWKCRLPQRAGYLASKTSERYTGLPAPTR